MTTPFKLGRVQEHDPRSLDYPAPSSASVVSRRWRLYAPVLDQGQVGSCTGNATAQALNHWPFHTAGTTVLTEDDAVKIYSEATVLDGYPGTYPPDDTGSSGLAAAKAAQSFGLITGYQHAFGLDHVLSAAMSGPLIVGTRWHQDMFNPDASARVRPTGAVVGGHEYCLDGVNVTARTFRFLNSWSANWGYRGHFWMTWDDFATLLNDGGDAVLFVK